MKATSYAQLPVGCVIKLAVDTCARIDAERARRLRVIRNWPKQSWWRRWWSVFSGVGACPWYEDEAEMYAWWDYDRAKKLLQLCEKCRLEDVSVISISVEDYEIIRLRN